MSHNRNIIICNLGNTDNDPRPKRMLEFYKSKKFQAFVCSDKSANDSFIELTFKDLRNSSSFLNFFLRNTLKILRKIVISNFIKDFLNSILFGYIGLSKKMKSQEFDIIFCHDIYLLDFALSLKKKSRKAKVFFDAREYYPEQFQDSFSFKFLETNERRRILKKNIHKVDKFFTVSENLRSEYKKEFDRTPDLMMSLPFKMDLNVQKTTQSLVRIVHHGVANRNRQIEKMMKIVDKADSKFKFDLFLTGDKKYIQFLKMFETDRIKIRPAIDFSQIIQTLNGYDIGFFYVEPTTKNLEFCLPNKFFEFIQARLAVFTGPSIEMKNLIDKYNCGFYSQDFSIENATEKLDSISMSQLQTLKENSNAASKFLCFEEQVKNLNLDK